MREDDVTSVPETVDVNGSSRMQYRGVGGRWGPRAEASPPPPWQPV